MCNGMDLALSNTVDMKVTVYSQLSPSSLV